MSRPIGIDLGTTYSAIAGWKDSGLVIGPDCFHFPQEEQYFIASKIFMPNFNSEEDGIIFGKGAIKRYETDPDKFFSAFKRGMDDNKPIERPPYGKKTPIELSTLLLKHMMAKAVNPVEGTDFIPEGVVVSVPYYFKEPSCKNTFLALSNALEQVYFNNLGYEDDINLGTVAEPIAAGLDYAFSQCDGLSKQNILVFDLGGGTFDVTIYELNNDKSKKSLKFTVLATDGDARLGGEDFDASIRKFILKKEGIDENIQNDPKYKSCIASLKLQITETKCILSSTDSSSIVINSFFDRPILDFTLTREHIESLLIGELGSECNYISKIQDIVERCLSKSELRSQMIDRVVLVGGSSKIPCIRRMLESLFGKEKIYQAPKPSETVARGACIWATYQLDLRNKDTPNYQKHLHYWDEIIVKPKTAHSLGIINAYNTVENIIASNKFTPVSGTRIYQPSRLSDDGTKAELDPLIIVQGKEKIGEIPFPVIYTHGRQRKDIRFEITLVAEPTNVKVLIKVPKGNMDGSDIYSEGEILFS